MIIKRFILLNKRLYKHATYVILLLLIPIAVLAFKLAADSDSHLMKIGVFVEDESSEVAELLLNELSGVREEISFSMYASKEEAIGEVKNAAIDEAWIIPADLDETFARLAAGRRPKATVTVYIREAGVSHRFMQELLESKAFRIYSPEVFAKGVLEDFPEGEGLDEYKKTFYDKAPDNSIFSYIYLDKEDAAEESYLLMPVRGLLAILLLITAFAAAIFYMEDSDKGLFAYWHSRFGNLRAFGYYAVVIFNSAVLVLLSLFAAEINVGLCKEIVNLAVYCVAIILFAMIVRMIVGSVRVMGLVMPPVVIMSLVLSPIFVDMRGLRAMQAVIPSFYYLMSTHDSSYLVRMAFFCLCETVILEVIYRIKSLKA